VEINRVAEVLFIAKSAARELDSLDPAIDTFDRAVYHLQDNSIQNAPAVIFDLSWRPSSSDRGGSEQPRLATSSKI